MSIPSRAERRWLLESPRPLVHCFDVALLDLDGTVYVGAEVVPGAPAVLATARDSGLRPAFVTNNAARPPAVVAEHLTGLGIPCVPTEVVTAAQAGAVLVAQRVPPGSRVLAVGGAGVVEALREVGLEPVERADTGAAAVLQGWTPELSWAQLAEGAYALADGLPWIVTNTDLTIPTGRGIAPGNGSFVALLAGATGRTPDAVAGKPQPPLLEQAVARLAAASPLVVGDRLDTDIEGAAAVDLPSLLVLTGVTGIRALLEATEEHRPTYLSSDLSGLLRGHPATKLRPDGHGWSCNAWTATVVGTPPRLALARTERLEGTGDHDDALRACCAVVWATADEGRQVVVEDSVLALVEASRAASGQEGA